MQQKSKVTSSQKYRVAFNSKHVPKNYEEIDKKDLQKAKLCITKFQM